MSTETRRRLQHRSGEIGSCPPAPLLTLGDVVAYTRVSEKTIRRAVRSGRLCAFKLPGGLRFRVVDVDAWLESYAVRPDPPRQPGGRRTLSDVLA